MLWLIPFILAALFAAMDQIVRFPDRFLPVSRLPEIWYTWDLGTDLPFDDAAHFYQGAKMWFLALAWWMAPAWIEWYMFIGLMIIWWAIIRNAFLHKVLTDDVWRWTT